MCRACRWNLWSDELVIGDWVVNIGNPIGFTGTATAGIVSGLNREIASDNSAVDKYGRSSKVVNSMIQTDAAINSGNSGGGMFNVLGQLMGIPSMVYRGSSSMSLFSNTASVESIGMCIPINVAKDFVREALEKYDAEAVKAEQDKADREASRNNTGDDIMDKPRLGITMATLSASNTAVANGVLPRGCIVREVESGAPAEAAGIKVGDIIVEVDGVVITDASALQQEILKHSANDTVTVKVYRAQNNPLEAQYISDIGEGEYIEIPVTLQVVQKPAA